MYTEKEEHRERVLVWSASVADLLLLLLITHCLLDGKADSEQDANTSNSDVCCTKEGVLASDPCCGGKHDLLGARELGQGNTSLTVNLIVWPSLRSVLITRYSFLKVGRPEVRIHTMNSSFPMYPQRSACAQVFLVVPAVVP